MHLNPGQHAQLVEHLRIKWGEHARCHVCHSDSWMVSTDAFLITSLPGPDPRDQQTEKMPVAAVHCRECGNIVLVKLSVAGIDFPETLEAASADAADNPTRKPWTDLDAIRERVAQASWYHSFEIVPGVVTPGQSEMDPAARLNMFGVPDDLRGMKALDIGTWDGPVAFELERRGAEVTALDVQDPDETGFNTAKEILGSRVTYLQCDVVSMRDRIKDAFDLIVYCGVYYHIKNPVEAFESIALCLTENGMLCFEGEGFLHYAETLAGIPDTELPLEAMAASDVPLALAYAASYKQASNWFIPNLACLKSWLQSAGLTMTTHHFFSLPEAKPFPGQRIYGTAKKTGVPAVEHPLVGKMSYKR